MAEKSTPARRAASFRSVENMLLTTGCVAIKINRIGNAHAANLSHDLNTFCGTNTRMMAIGREKMAKK